MAQDLLIQVGGAKLHEDGIEGLGLEDVEEPDDERVVRPVQGQGFPGGHPGSRLLRPVLLLQLHGVDLTRLRVQDLEHLAEATGAQGLQQLEGREPHGVAVPALPALLQELRQLLAHAAGKHHGREAVRCGFRRLLCAGPGPAAAACIVRATAAQQGTEEAAELLRDSPRAVPAPQQRLRPQGAAGFLIRTAQLLLGEELHHRGRHAATEDLCRCFAPPVLPGNTRCHSALA
mmetsp:Transcript_110149/g.355531  ORF Transcript_110149/g.355531 Transcript_110149/m.355531 type:complete len:232 (+) Transcript_110149:893-1588(+)